MNVLGSIKQVIVDGSSYNIGVAVCKGLTLLGK